MIADQSLSVFTRSFWLTLVSFALFALAFVFYFQSEKQIDRINENRVLSHDLSEELLQTSDDLTRMVRSYVVTGDLTYKNYYFYILDVREGKQPRPANGRHSFWDLTPGEGGQPRTEGSRGIPLMQLMQKAGLNEQEFTQLELAKTNSDILTKIEREAMYLVENPGPNVDLSRDRAIRMLHDEAYRAAKFSIMRPIEEAHELMERRLQQALADAEKHTDQLRLLFMLIGFITVGLLWHAYRSLSRVLGANVSALHASLVSLGKGEFDQPAPVTDYHGDSVMGWIQVTQGRLAQIQQQKYAEEQKNQRINQLYLALAQCNQSILRITEQQDLFPRICRDAVILAGLKMAWVAIYDKRQNRFFAPAWFGVGVDELEYNQFFQSEESGQSHLLQTQALLANQAIWCQDLTDPTLPLEMRMMAQRHGWGSAAVLPLSTHQQVVGTFNLYAESQGAFDEVVQTLLSEFVIDVGHVLNRFELEEEKQHALHMEELRSFMLEKVTAAIGLQELLHEVVIKVESMFPDCICSILLLDSDGVSIKTGATPSLPDFYSNAIHGVHVGPGVGSCGNTIATGKRTIVSDLSAHPYWKDYWPLAEKAGLRACWSEPIFSSAAQPIGAFAIYHEEVREPSEFFLHLLEMAAGLIAIGIERKQSGDTLRKLSQAVAQSSNAIIIVDQRIQIEYANSCYLQNVGMTLEQVKGKKPSLLRSGKTPAATYIEMWDSLNQGESWKGELINRYADGIEHVDLTHISPIRDEHGVVTHFLAIQEDITDKKKNDERIRHLAHYDALTGLPNRTLLEEKTRAALRIAEKNQEKIALMFLDLDHFKDVNDTLGHSTGDAMLIDLAGRLTGNLREDDVVSRLGGDEFIILLTNINEHKVEKVVQKMIDVVSAPFTINGFELNVTPSIGIAMYPCDGSDLETLSRNADAAMYMAKHSGRNTFRFFTQEMQERSLRHLELVNALRHALNLNQFELHYQPQISLLDDRVIGAEALLRWRHPVLGMVSPAEFIPVAEESGMILEIGEWVMHTAVNQLRDWRAAGMPELLMAVNLSAVQFRHKDLPEMVARILREAAVPPSCLELELTESVAMHEPLTAITIMNQLHEQGVRMSIDDFGTGYSSLSYLKQFKVYKLKIDQSFVRDITSDPEDKAIVSAVISMARNLGLMTIAEGVETPEQLAFLRQHACDEVQGYLFSRPLPASQFAEFLQQSFKPEPALSQAQLKGWH
ncbi:EAL domain-containing protein [Undibacterium rugosum]|uniref:bifunctional diguanylate cyclase/phosphodiesterase n=1 Tax=Undibacterium rugosum TaxID=2762291 RepID=UPI001B830861|nr:EAL domain-containing protein [Undibacterium rugosum]MBR7777964.1 EAL domain-containing protein [Undibacterium rugosum]